MPTYYVSNSGSDAADGLSTGTAWRTLGKVSGFTFAANDQVLLERGGRWRESLTVPRSNLTIGAYGAAAVTDGAGYVTNAPIIDGGEFVTGWSSYSGGVSDSYYTDNFSGTSGANISTSVPEVGSGSWSAVLSTPALLLSSDGMARRSATVGIHQSQLSTTLPKPSYYAEAVIRIKSLFAGSSDVALLCVHMNPSGQGSDTFLYAGPILNTNGTTALRVGLFDHNANSFHDVAQTFTASTTYTLRMEVDADNAILKTYLGGVLMDTYDFSATFLGTFRQSSGQVGLRMGSGSTPAGADGTGMQIDSLDVGPIGGPGTPVNTYQAALGTDPLIVDLRGAYSKPGNGVNLLANGENAWKNGTLYVRSDSGIPSNTDVVAGTRTTGLSGGTTVSTTIQGIAFEHTRQRAIEFTGGSGLVIDGVMAQRTSGGAAPANGVIGLQSHSAPTIQNVIVRNCGSDSIYMSACPNFVVQDSKLGPAFGDAADGLQHDGTGTINGRVSRCSFYGNTVSPKGLLILFGDTYLIEDCYFESSKNFHIALLGNGGTVKRCVHYGLQSAINGAGGAIEITDNAATAFSTFLFDHNVYIDCNPAINIWGASNSSAARTGLRIIANTIVNTTVAPTQWQVNFQSPVAGEFQDNIVWDTTGTAKAYKLTTVNAAGWTSDYNDLGPAGTGFISFQGTTYNTLAAYVAAKSRDTHSISANPLFVNLGGHAADGSDYRLQTGSPAIATGTPISGVVTVPNMGAKEAPVALTGVIAASSSTTGAAMKAVARWRITPSNRWPFTPSERWDLVRN